jgi:DNA-binding NarL/FixJ family response regulator
VDVVRAAMAIDDRERAEEAATEAGKAAEAALAPCWHAFAAQARGLLGDDVELLLEAVSGFRQSLRPLYLAPALEDAADALARTGRAEEARPLAFEAIELYEAADAVTDAALARRRLRAAGLPLGARGRRARARSGWESLSESELRVVRLVAEGLTNREIADRLFLSRDTVHSHVSNALRKLALRSRVELAAQAGRRNL